LGAEREVGKGWKGVDELGRVGGDGYDGCVSEGGLWRSGCEHIGE
jgi:hypothetical protein